jgi:hypothetical protein
MDYLQRFYEATRSTFLPTCVAGFRSAIAVFFRHEISSRVAIVRGGNLPCSRALVSADPC